MGLIAKKNNNDKGRRITEQVKIIYRHVKESFDVHNKRRNC